MSSYSDLIVFDDRQQPIFSTLGDAEGGYIVSVRRHVFGGGRSKPLGALTLGDEDFITVTARIKNTTAVLLHPSGSESTFLDFISSVDIAYDILNHFFTSPHEGITVVDSDAILRYISPVHEKFFGLNHGEGIGKPVQEVIENTRLHEVARRGAAEIGQVQEMKDVTRIVTRVPIHRDGKLVGAIGRVMFKAPEEVHALSRHISSLRAEVNYYKKELAGLRQRTLGLEAIVGESDAIRQLKSEIIKVAPLDVPVFISGESGTGKELVAHAVHNLSRREERPMVLVNCGALPDTLVESELFGYDAGAFTGAKREGRIGKFEMADRSSLFLDEIGDMPIDIQVKLLRVIENGVFERLGNNKQLNTNFRLISATNRDLRRRIANNEFRADLYFRINGITLKIPPLRERTSDIPLLAAHFIERIAHRIGSSVMDIEPAAIEMLKSLPWPGNVRQLYHEIQRAMVFASGSTLTVNDFTHLYNADDDLPAPQHDLMGQAKLPSTIREATGNVELSLIREALERLKGNKKKVAEELGISRSYLYKKLAELENESALEA